MRGLAYLSILLHKTLCVLSHKNSNWIKLKHVKVRRIFPVPTFYTEMLYQNQQERRMLNIFEVCMSVTRVIDEKSAERPQWALKSINSEAK